MWRGLFIPSTALALHSHVLDEHVMLQVQKAQVERIGDDALAKETADVLSKIAAAPKQDAPAKKAEEPAQKAQEAPAQKSEEGVVYKFTKEQLADVENNILKAYDGVKYGDGHSTPTEDRKAVDAVHFNYITHKILYLSTYLCVDCWGGCIRLRRAQS